MIAVGSVCRSRDRIVKAGSDDEARLCRVVAVVPATRWHDPKIAEYKVELLAMPITAFRRATDLEILSS